VTPSENQHSTHVVRLELWLDGESPTGLAVGSSDQARQFAGWLGLIAAVEALIGDDREPGIDAGGGFAGT
jgi:hypothetical protein